MIDLRSDTVTRPTQGMLDTMMSAKVGDDVFGEDPTITALENYAANLLGAEEGLFCPSGTMTNQIGIKVLSNPYEEVICYKGSHIYKYEGGGVAGTSGLSFRLLEGERGKLEPEQIESEINPDDIHFPKSSIVALENTVNKGGGSCYSIKEVSAISTLARKHNLRMHLDGARLFNALVATGDKASDYGPLFDTISVCLSKGLGAPVGSILVGKSEFIKQGRRVRKFLGGGMRQAGYLAAAGLYALKNNIERLKDDHEKANKLASALSKSDMVKEVHPVETNIVIFKIIPGNSVDSVMHTLKENGILAVPFGADEIRLVTHLDVSDIQIEVACDIIENL